MAARLGLRSYGHLARAQNAHVRTFGAWSSWRQAQPATATVPSHRPLQGIPPQKPRNSKVRPSGSASNDTLAKRAPRVSTPHPLTIEGKEHSFSPLLLRDLCSCPHCIDQSTRQKLFYSADIPADIKVTESYVENDVYRFRWSKDVAGYGENHISSIPVQALGRLVHTGSTEEKAPTLPTRTFWVADQFQQETSDFEYDAYMNDDKSLLKALRQLHSHGMVFIRGVPDDETSVEQLAERIGPLKTTFYGKTWDVRSVPDAKNVAYTAQNLGFHMDLMYMEQPPFLQLLHCIRSSSTGGASLFSDSFKAVEELAENDLGAFNALSNVRIDYHYNHPGSQYYHQRRSVIEQQRRSAGPRNWPSYGAMKGDAGVEKLDEAVQARAASLTPMDFVNSVAWSPPFQAPPTLQDFIQGDGGPGASELLSQRYQGWHSAAQAFNKLIHRPEAIFERLMKPGEFVIFDNRRVLHARKAFEVGDAGKERWLRGGYVDEDPFRSKLHVMGRQEMETRS